MSTSGIEKMNKQAQILEDIFFAEKEAKLVRHYREEKEQAQKLADLTATLPHFPKVVLEHLLGIGIDSHTIMAVQLIPLIEMAWASGMVADAEHEAVMRAAHRDGIEDNSTTMEMLKKWLKVKPDPKLFEVWKEFILFAKSEFSAEDFATLKKHTHDWAVEVAEAYGGFLGFNAISDDERVVLNKIDAFFS